MIDVGTHENPWQYLLLDHGYVRHVGHWGSEEEIIEAARMSTGKGFKGWGRACDFCGGPGSPDLPPGTFCGECQGSGLITGDEKLLRYLYVNKHMTPFEQAGLTIEVQAPIFVFREWHRHRTQSFNEMSARYAPLPDVNYVPSVERMMMSGGANKQAQGATDRPLDLNIAVAARDRIADMYDRAQTLYQQLLDAGVPKELARVILPVGRYSRMRASANLRNWLQFMTLRCDEHAQFEIREYANAVSEIVRGLFPRTWELWNGTDRR